MKAKEIFAYLETYFPLDQQEPWDHCGIQVGSSHQEVHKVMIALDASYETVLEAIDHQVDLLITHHPLLLDDYKNFDFDEPMGRILKLAIEHQITIYSLHTCLDHSYSTYGMNRWVMELLDVKDAKPYDDLNMGLMGTLSKVYSLEQLITYLKERLPIHFVRSAGNKKEIKIIACLAGSGSDDLEKLVGKVDAFITGDSKYRHAKYAKDHDLVLIDVGHHVEVIMVNQLKELLSHLDIEIICGNSKDFYQYWR